MKRENAWKNYRDEELVELEELARSYKEFISSNKTERECATAAIALAEAKGYRPLEQAIAEGRALKSIRTEYVSEARFGESFTVSWGEENGEYFIQGEGEKPVFRMRMEYSA